MLGGCCSSALRHRGVPGGIDVHRRTTVAASRDGARPGSELGRIMRCSVPRRTSVSCNPLGDDRLERTAGAPWDSPCPSVRFGQAARRRLASPTVDQRARPARSLRAPAFADRLVGSLAAVDDHDGAEPMARTSRRSDGRRRAGAQRLHRTLEAAVRRSNASPRAVEPPKRRPMVALIHALADGRVASRCPVRPVLVASRHGS